MPEAEAEVVVGILVGPEAVAQAEEATEAVMLMERMELQKPEAVAEAEAILLGLR